MIHHLRDFDFSHRIIRRTKDFHQGRSRSPHLWISGAKEKQAGNTGATGEVGNSAVMAEIEIELSKGRAQFREWLPVKMSEGQLPFTEEIEKSVDLLVFRLATGAICLAVRKRTFMLRSQRHSKLIFLGKSRPAPSLIE